MSWPKIVIEKFIYLYMIKFLEKKNLGAIIN